MYNRIKFPLLLLATVLRILLLKQLGRYRYRRLRKQHHRYLKKGTTAPLPATAASPNFSTYHFLPHVALGIVVAITFTQNTNAGNGNERCRFSASLASEVYHGAKTMGGVEGGEVSRFVNVDAGEGEKTAVPTRQKPTHSSHSRR